MTLNNFHMTNNSRMLFDFYDPCDPDLWSLPDCGSPSSDISLELDGSLTTAEHPTVTDSGSSGTGTGCLPDERFSRWHGCLFGVRFPSERRAWNKPMVGYREEGQSNVWGSMWQWQRSTLDIYDFFVKNYETQHIRQMWSGIIIHSAHGVNWRVSMEKQSESWKDVCKVEIYHPVQTWVITIWISMVTFQYKA